MARIYVASLLDYNCGAIHGEWFDLNDLPDEASLFHEIKRMLEKSPMMARGCGTSEEFVIHDYEDFGGFSISEYAPLDFVCRLAELVEEHGPAFAIFVDNVYGYNVGTADDLDGAERAFTDAWIGHMTAEEYAEELLDERDDIPEDIRQYVDAERLARDMELGGDVYETHEHGEVYLFHQNW